MNTQDKKMIASLFNSIMVSKIMVRGNDDHKSRDKWHKYEAMATVALADEFGIELSTLDLARQDHDQNDPEFQDFLINVTFRIDTNETV